MNQTMNDLALLAIGLGGGFLLAVIAVMVYVLWSSSRQMQKSLDVFLRTIPSLRDQIANSIDKLRNEVSVGLSRMDAERLYSTSISLQRLVKSLSGQVDQLQKVVFAQPTGPALDFTEGGIGMEAEDDARGLREPGAWAPTPTPMNNTYADTDPLAGLTEDQRRQRVMEYFERQRAAKAGYPYAPNSNPLSSAPPTAGSGAYASLLEEAGRTPVPTPAPLDFSGLESEEGVDLVDKGELA